MQEQSRKLGRFVPNGRLAPAVAIGAAGSVLQLMRNRRGVFLQGAGRQQAEGAGFAHGVLGEGAAACVQMTGLSRSMLQR